MMNQQQEQQKNETIDNMEVFKNVGKEYSETKNIDVKMALMKIIFKSVMQK